MEELTAKELRILIFLTRLRIKNEARRPTRIGRYGDDIQSLKVYELSDLLDKLEKMQLER